MKNVLLKIFLLMIPYRSILQKKTSRHGTDHSLSDKLSEQDIIFHSTYDLEENFMNMIRKGDYISISNLLENSPIFKKDVMESKPSALF